MTVFWTDERIREALRLPAIGEKSDPGSTVTVGYATVSTDTRSLEPGSLFVALAGERFDAHEFLQQAADAGATGAVVERIPEGAPGSLEYYQVEDTLAALGSLAAYRRDQLGARVVAVVGSNGKTTTKELLRAALGERFRVHATEGNFNNQIGLPLTILAAPDDAEVLVLELGTSMPGEVAILARIARPDAGVITSIGEEHLELLGDLEGVLTEETSLLTELPADGPAYVAEEPEELPARAIEMNGRDRVHIAGFSERADLRPDNGSDGIEYLPDGSTRWQVEGVQVELPLPGRYNVRNALLAIGLARDWGVALEDAAARLARVRPTKLRGEWHQYGGVKVLADCYNSNPPSALAAIELLTNVPAEGSKILVLGTMREMGESAERLHRQVADAAVPKLGKGIDTIVATGDFVAAFEPHQPEHGKHIILSQDPLAGYEQLEPDLQGSETLLLKASRGEALERWLPLLEAKFANVPATPADSSTPA